MVKKVYNVKDSKGGFYLMPFYVHSEEEALRFMRNSVLDVTHPFAKNPEDFDLYYLGEFDDITGKFDLLDSPAHLVKLDNYKVGE